MKNAITLIGMTVLMCVITTGLFAQQGRRDNQPRNVSFSRYETVPVGSAAFNAALGRSAGVNVPYTLIESGRAHDNSVHYYLYYMGYVNFVPLAHGLGVHYNGVTNRTITFEVTEATERTISESVTKATEQTWERNTGNTAGIEVGVKAGIEGFGSVEVRGSFSHTWGSSFSNTVSTSNTLETSLARIRSETTSISSTIGENREPAGLYRNVLFATTDVFVMFEVHPTRRNIIRADIISTARPLSYAWGIDYDSGTGGFGKTGEGDLFKIPDLDFSRIPVPTRALPAPPRPPAEKVERREFTNPGNNSFVFGRNVAATVEVYVLGAGGGGQGGHTKAYQQGIGTRTERGFGASGGGGAAAYMMFNTTGPFSLDITIGAGGTAGNVNTKGVGGSWESGHAGGAGGDTTVKFNTSTLTVAGGRGGGGSGQNVTGGAGGVTGHGPSGITLLSWATERGVNGDNGRHNNDQRSQGGASGRITRQGSEASFGAGQGSSRAQGTHNFTEVQAGGGGVGGLGQHRGSAGGNGFVLIIVKYFE